LRGLAGTDTGSADAYVATVSAMRARNRIQHAVDQALAAVGNALNAMESPALPGPRLAGSVEQQLRH
jgi:hypothetical protein